MILYRVLDRHIVGSARNVVYRRHLCEWILSQEVAKDHIKYNPRHLPVVIRKPENEDYYMRWAIARILRGWRTFRITSASPPPPTFT